MIIRLSDIWDGIAKSIQIVIVQIDKGFTIIDVYFHHLWTHEIWSSFERCKSFVSLLFFHYLWKTIVNKYDFVVGYTEHYVFRFDVQMHNFEVVQPPQSTIHLIQLRDWFRTQLLACLSCSLNWIFENQYIESEGIHHCGTSLEHWADFGNATLFDCLPEQSGKQLLIYSINLVLFDGDLLIPVIQTKNSSKTTLFGIKPASKWRRLCKIDDFAINSEFSQFYFHSHNLVIWGIILQF